MIDDPHLVLDSACAVLADVHGIEHATLQVEPFGHQGCAVFAW